MIHMSAIHSSKDVVRWCEVSLNKMKVFTVCIPDHSTNELNKIRAIARNNGYKGSTTNRLIMSMHNNKKRNFNEQNSEIYIYIYLYILYNIFWLKYKLHKINICRYTSNSHCFTIKNTPNMSESVLEDCISVLVEKRIKKIAW